MRNYIQRQLLELLDTVRDGIGYLAASRGDTADLLRTDCMFAIKQILDTMERNDAEFQPFYQEKLSAVLNDLEGRLAANQAHTTLQRIDSVQQKLRGEPVRLELAFLPYKLSMWDCMESVWLAAKGDPNCDSYVVPIPYYDRNPDQSMGAMHYEGAEFPKEIGAIDYHSYDIAARHPDIVYIHNPYDDSNLVTSVAPPYYSYELKKNTDCLVYIPYCIYGGPKVPFFSAYRFADYIVAQSREMKRGLLNAAVPGERILALGNPKFDAIVNHSPAKVPPEWQAKLRGRTVLLVNTSLADLLAHNERWLYEIQGLLLTLSEDKECAIIWRPHPLMEATLQSMRPEQLQFYQKMKRLLLGQDNFVMDANGSCLPAFDCSHALISDYSSIMWQYAVTEKPVLCLTGDKASRLNAEYKVLDDSEFYFLHDGVSVEDFVSMVKTGQDINKKKRLAALKASTLNLDGTVGEKVHREVTRNYF